MPMGVDGAGGVPALLPEAKWYVAIVNNRSEKANAGRLSKMGIENYVPIQTVFRLWKNGKKAKVEKVVIPAVIFIRCTEKKRREVVKLPFVFRFMTNKAGTTADGTVGKPLAVISDSEINQLKFMLGQSDVPVTITDRKLKKGDKVKVIRGALAGLSGEVYLTDANKNDVMVALEHFGFAKLLIDTINLEVIKDK